MVHKRVEVTDQTFKRLQDLAEPLVDSVEDVIVRLLDSHVLPKEGGVYSSGFLGTDSRSLTHPPTKSVIPSKARESLAGFRKELWELVVQKLPPTFSLHEVYNHMDPLVKLRPHVQEMQATIRHAMQRLRDMGYVEFLDRGEYRRID